MKTQILPDGGAVIELSQKELEVLAKALIMDQKYLEKPEQLPSRLAELRINNPWIYDLIDLDELAIRSS